jgi:hypothetical protein
MKMKIAALALAAGMFAVPAFAASVASDQMQRVKLRGKMVDVHVMKMDDGSYVLGMTRADLERVLGRRVDEFNSYGPRR